MERIFRAGVEGVRVWRRVRTRVIEVDHLEGEGGDDGGGGEEGDGEVEDDVCEPPLNLNDCNDDVMG